MNISKMIDKQKGVKGKVVGKRKVTSSDIGQSSGWNKLDTDRGDYEYTKPATDEAKELDGSYGGFQPKPAVEVVIVAMKPLDKKGYLEQAQDNGKGVTWFDDCRIPFADESDRESSGFWGITKEEQSNELRKHHEYYKGYDDKSYVGYTKKKKSDYGKYVEKQKSFKNAKTIGTTIKGNEHFLGGDIKQLNPAENYQDTAEASPRGRFPANLLVSDNVLDDGKITNTNVKAGIRKAGNEFGQDSGWNDHTNVDSIRTGISDSGGYSRYFNLDTWFEKNLKSLPEPVQQTFPFMIVPKASKAEKNNGLDNFETKQAKGGGGTSNDTWYEDDVNAASGKFGSEKAPSRNIHPTVKPLTLMNYLVVLGSRKGDVVLEPFAGSGTTALACVGQERDYIAIEREEEYYEIAKARLEKVEQPLKMWEKFSG